MFNQITKKQIRITLAVVSFIVVVSLVWFIAIQISRVGKIAVTIETSPMNGVEVKVDNKPATRGVNYMSAGSHTFTAEKDGFDKAEQTVNVSTTNNYIALLPNAVSKNAQNEISTVDESAHAQTISGIASQRSGADFQERNLIVSKLPHTDINGPYEIDYGYNEDDSSKVYLIVSYSSKEGRKQAVQWLKKNNVNITTTEIVFSDFVNQAKADGHD